MIRAALVFFVMAVTAFVLSAAGVAGLSIEIGKVLLWAFVIMALISLGVGLLAGGGPGPLTGRRPYRRGGFVRPRRYG